MTEVRKIKKIIKGKPTIEGAGVHLNRVFGFNEPSTFDPFLLLDDFHSDKKADYINGFPWHPHRGIETITYMIKGNVEHKDSLGNKGVLEPGDIQWMTAGSGIIHQEMPKGDVSDNMWGLQLWTNLPAANKMMEPHYQDIKSKDIPEVILEEGTKVRVICGKVGAVEGPVKGVVSEPEYLDVFLTEGNTFERIFPKGHTVFAYILQGEGLFFEDDEKNENRMIAAENIVLYEEGDKIVIKSHSNKLRFVLISGKPIKEPIAWYGPIVMNTQEELRIAFDEYRNDTFLKHK